MVHIKWERQKMKVKLATQVFSISVADALEYCNQHLQLPQFRGCEETVDFLRTIDAAFDVLNSRNPLGKGYKAPMRTSENKLQQSLQKQSPLFLSETAMGNLCMLEDKNHASLASLLVPEVHRTSSMT
ncbi:unnamed protein product [Knipowitschia caucasica]